jgi:endonuclease III
VKTDTTHAKQFSALVRELKRKFKPEAPAGQDPVARLIVSFLEWNASTRQALDAYAKLMAHMVDCNDLRVSHSHELIALLGSDYPQVEHRTTRLRESMQDIYVREHAVSLSSLADRPKKEVRAYLDSLCGIPQYVAAQVTLLCFGGHAIPIDDKMASLLIEEGAVPAGASVHEIAGFLERQVKASDGVQVHLLMRAWADSKRRKESLAGPASPAAAKSTKSAGPTKTTVAAKTTRTVPKRKRPASKKK